MKKKVIALLLAGAVLVSAAGCGETAATAASAEGEEAVLVTEDDTESITKKQTRDTVIYNAADYVTLGDYKGIEVELDDDYTVTDDDVKKEVEIEIGYIGDDYVETDKTTVENGDMVNIDYVGKKDGVAFNGGTAEGKNLKIGSGEFIPGFEDGLIGAKVGDTVDLNLTFPEQYQNAELAGQDVVFTVTVNGIMEAVPMTYETLTDEWVQKNMQMDSVDEYLKEVRDLLQEYTDQEKEDDITLAALEKLRKNCTVKSHPEGLDDERVEQSMDLYRNSAQANGMDLETYLSVANQTEEGLREGLKESARQAVDTELILMAIADAEGIASDDAAFEKYVEELCEDYGFTDQQSLYDMYDKEYVHRNYCMDKARELVVNNAKVTFKPKDTKETESTEEDTEKDKESTEESKEE